MIYTVKQFIEKHIELIENDDFKSMYILAESQIPSQIGNLTVNLIKAGINPLDSLSTVWRFMFADSMIDTIYIPDNIEGIDSQAFRSCYYMQSVSIPRDIKYIHQYAFFACYGLSHIEYRGTVEEFKNIDLHPSIFTDCDTSIVHCLDGDVIVSEAS